MIRTRLEVGGSRYIDYENLQVVKAVSDNTTSSFFNAILDSPYGRHKNDFTVGNDVKVYADANELMPGSLPVAQWLLNSMNLGGSLIFDTTNTYGGSVFGTITFPAGKINNAAYNAGSDANDRIEITNPDTYVFSLAKTTSNQSGNSTNLLSISYWVYMPSAGSYTSSSRHILGKSVAATGHEWAHRITSHVGISGTHAFFFFGSPDVSQSTSATINNVIHNQWHHFVATGSKQDPSGLFMEFYMDGVSRASATKFSYPEPLGPNRNSPVEIFQRSTEATVPCYVDDLRIYNYVLSPEEVRAIYNGGSGTEVSNNGSQLIFRGLVDNIGFQGQGLSQNVELRGRDYSARLVDNTVEPVVYTNTEIGSIVRDIIRTNTTDIGSANINNTSTTLKRIAFNQLPISDAVKQLADLSNYSFYVDHDKDLHFELGGSISTNQTFHSGNILQMNFDKTREGMANKIWVYGDRYLAGFKEILRVGSPNVGGNLGSTFALTYKPHNLRPEILGSIYAGGIYELNVNAPSGTTWMVSFHDRLLIFPSGTTYGYFLPPSGGSIVVTYERDVPIVKYGESRNSINAFGPKSIVINDKSIKDPNTAISLLNNKIAEADPLNNIELKLKGWYNFSPGQTANVAIGDFNLNESGVQIIEMRYDFDPKKSNSEDVISVKLDKRQINITDKIFELKKRLDLLEAQDKLDTDVITRLEHATGSLLIVGSYWELTTIHNGSEFRVWPTSNVPPLGSNFTPRLGLLNSGVGIGAGSISYLASGTFGTSTLVRSGGWAGY